MSHTVSTAAAWRVKLRRFIFLSDTHGLHEEIAVPDGDILIHAGDFGRRGTLAELVQFHAWLLRQPHKHKIFVAGNHDWCFETQPNAARDTMRGVTYLQDEAVTILGLKFYGSPWQPRFLDWAFNLDRGEPLKRVWAKIPADTDVLITGFQ
jgi:hypothetical protein